MQWMTESAMGSAVLSSARKSLEYFKPRFMRLTSPHPLWKSAGSNPYEISKAIQQARFLSGRYRTNELCSKWSGTTVWCRSCPSQEVETIEHIILKCEGYSTIRKRLLSLCLNCPDSAVLPLVQEAFSSSTAYKLQFLLDCSALPKVIVATQIHGPEFWIPSST